MSQSFNSSFRIQTFVVRFRPPRGSLPHGLVENDSGGDRDVERFYPAEQRDMDERVAALAHEPPKALALAAEQKRARLRPVPFGVRGRGLRHRADRPHAAPLQLFDEPRDVHSARHGHVFERARRRLRNRLRESRRASFGDEDAVSARALGGANYRAEVARVFDAVEHDRERRLSGSDASGERVEKFIRRCIARGGDCGDDALMVRARRESLKLGARRASDWNAAHAREFKNLLQARLVRALRDRDALDGPRARAQRFEHGLYAEEDRAVLRLKPPASFRLERPATLRARVVRVRVCLRGLRARLRARLPVALFTDGERARHALARRLARHTLADRFARILAALTCALILPTRLLISLTCVLLLWMNTFTLLTRVLALLSFVLTLLTRVPARLARVLVPLGGPPGILFVAPASLHESFVRPRSASTQRRRA